MAKNTSKKLVPLPDDILADVLKASVKEDSTTKKFVEDALKHAVRMNALGVSSSQLIDVCEVTQANRVLGGTFVPMDVLNYLTRKAYAEDKATFQAEWYESGVLYGKYLKEKFDDPVDGFTKFLLATRWDLNEVKVIRHKDFLKFRCVSNVLSFDETESLVKFIDGVMHGMGCRTEKIDYVKGLVAVEIK